MSRLFGWDLPPGVTSSMIPGNRPEDELAERISEGWRPRCSNCGGFLRLHGPVETRTDESPQGRVFVEFKTCRSCGVENVIWSEIELPCGEDEANEIAAMHPDWSGRFETYSW
jgi:hypothetical protein